MTEYYFGNIHDWDDSPVELARLHALTDIAAGYFYTDADDSQTKIENIGFVLQMLHDMAAALESEFERLAAEKAAKGGGIK